MTGPRPSETAQGIADVRRALPESSERESRATEHGRDVEGMAVQRLSEWAEQSGLMIDRLKPRAHPARAARARFVVSLSARGSYGAVLRWVQRFDQSPRVASIERLVIKHVSDEQPVIGAYSTGFHAIRFRETEARETGRHVTEYRKTGLDAAEAHATEPGSIKTYLTEPDTALGTPRDFRSGAATVSLDADIELAAWSRANLAGPAIDTDTEALESNGVTASWATRGDVRDPFETRGFAVRKIAGRIRGRHREVKLVVEGAEERGVKRETVVADASELAEPALYGETALDGATDSAMTVDAYPISSASEGQIP
ncbi:MAG TPA: hypothetical protein VL424_15380 [Pararobbsia sp.]|nr:hypothetical protein [Pararobbsia sp.]